VRWVNQAECELLGVEAGAILRQTHFLNSFREAHHPKAAKPSSGSCRGSRPSIPFPRDHIRSDGRHLTLEIHEVLIRDARGVVTGIRSVMLDVTRRKEIEGGVCARGRIFFRSVCASSLDAPGHD